MMEDKETIRKQITDDIIKYLQVKGQELQTSGKPVEDQLIQMDVILDVIRFLDRYKENVQILNRHYLEKSKFER